MRSTLDTRSWADAGTRLLQDGLDRLTDADLDDPSALDGWTRRHLLAHLASNAEAIGRLLVWARTGVETPMYASPAQRVSDIETGAARADLRTWVCSSATELAAAMDGLPAQAWSAEVVTVQGRTVRATETAWMRARETCIHAVDLNVGVAFTDLPEGFLTALLDDVAAWRSVRPGPAVALATSGTHHEFGTEGPQRRVELPLATAAAWLVGRHPDPDLPELPRWL